MRSAKKNLLTLNACIVAFILCCVTTSALVGCGGSASDEGASMSSEQESNVSSEVSEKEEADASEEELATVTQAEIGQTYSTEDYDITFEEAYWDSANEEGVWHLPPEPTGQVYGNAGFSPNAPLFIVKTKITNKYTSPITPKWYYAGKALVNDKYEFNVEVENSSLTWTEIAPLETKEIFIYVTLSEDAKAQLENIKIDWGFDPAAKSSPIKEGSYVTYELFFEE